MSLFPFSSSKWASRTDNSGASSPSQSSSPSPQSPVSNSSWQGGNPSISAPLSALLLGRSALSSAPVYSAPLAGSNRPTKSYKHYSMPISSTQSLKLDPRIISISDDGYFVSGSKQLSPIVEQDYFSPEIRTLPLPVEDIGQQVTTPIGSDHSDTPRTLSPEHMIAFQNTYTSRGNFRTVTSLFDFP
jgi:hypothetical protein